MDLPLAPPPADGLAVVEPRDKLHRSSKLEELFVAGVSEGLFVGALGGVEKDDPIATGVGLNAAPPPPNIVCV
jgi:hypothetical protein